jgi:predicted dehydrogenase
MSKNLAIIGSGKIAPFHIEAAIHAGFIISSIAASQDSESVKILSTKYKIPKYFSNVSDLLRDNSFDCLSIMIPPAATEKILAEVASLNKPTLIEKPVALSSNFLENFTHKENIFVAFNRRFYETISSFKIMSTQEKGIYSFDVVESLDSNQTLYESIKNTIINNSIHMVDLIKYLIGNFEIKEFIFSKTNNTLIGRIFVGNDYTGELKISFNSKRNTKIEFESSNLNLLLNPLEIFQKFNDLKIIEPSTNTPIRRYSPFWNDEKTLGNVHESGPFKPGFAQQYTEFINFSQNNIIPLRLATLKDARSAIKICEMLTEQYKSNLNYIISS